MIVLGNIQVYKTLTLYNFEEFVRIGKQPGLTQHMYHILHAESHWGGGGNSIEVPITFSPLVSLSCTSMYRGGGHRHCY
jgi:hypothetical protein